MKTYLSILLALVSGSSGFAFDPGGAVPAGRAGAKSVPAPVQPPTGPPLADGLLAWDAETRRAAVSFGTARSFFTFGVRNVSTGPVAITGVRASCGCTAPKLPALPWTLAPGAEGKLEIAMDLAGKRGTISKPLTVITDHGFKTLIVRTDIEEPPAGVMSPQQRLRNLRIARTNRQAALKGECATCHATPALGKMGAELYQNACTICHEGENRAPGMPDLRHLTNATDVTYWREWVTSSEEGKLMPAFAIERGGILTAAQIDSLVTYLAESFPSPKRPEVAGTGKPIAGSSHSTIPQ